jgi:hypothetical protein
MDSPELPAGPGANAEVVEGRILQRTGEAVTVSGQEPVPHQSVQIA